jgi:hypothetical protein
MPGGGILNNPSAQMISFPIWLSLFLRFYRLFLDGICRAILQKSFLALNAYLLYPLSTSFPYLYNIDIFLF